MSVQAEFDPDAYRMTTHPQWDWAAAACTAWRPFFRQWLNPAMETMFDTAGTSEHAKRETWREVGDTPAEYDTGDELVGPGEPTIALRRR
jgi:hypothetical protein